MLVDNHVVETTRNLYIAKNYNVRVRIKCKGQLHKAMGVDHQQEKKVNAKGKKETSCPWVLLVSRIEVITNPQLFQKLFHENTRKFSTKTRNHVFRNLREFQEKEKKALVEELEIF